ncbi:MAG: hypothetical protein AAF703_02800 [Cyanobacteria bacterium P01_D01_bin.105]
MLKSPLLFSISILVTLFSWATVAQAEDIHLALSFDLPPAETAISTQAKPKHHINPTLVDSPLADKILDQQQLSGAEKPAAEQQISIDTLIRPQAPLRSISESLPPKSAASTAGNSSTSPFTQPQDIGVQFLKDTLAVPAHTAPNNTTPKSQQATTDHQPSVLAVSDELDIRDESDELAQLEDWIFEGGSKSLVAHTVGSAEGTRHWSGQRTPAYYGHTDPGNGVWNLGTFSYQHEASDPEDADRRQLKRLKAQARQLKQLADQQGLQLSLQEKLNGLDLANQAPIAALGEGGYIDRLAQAYRLQMTGDEAIAWARTRAYIDPETKTWNAPGLGNNLYSISKDQERRMSAIDKALRAYAPISHPELELASLDSIRIESSGLENGSALQRAALGSTTTKDDTFGSVTEEFKLAAHDVAIEGLSEKSLSKKALTEKGLSMEQASLVSAAVSFDLPSTDSALTDIDKPRTDNILSSSRAKPISTEQAAPRVASFKDELGTSSDVPVDIALPSTAQQVMADTVMPTGSETVINKPAIALKFSSAISAHPSHKTETYESGSHEISLENTEQLAVESHTAENATADSDVEASLTNTKLMSDASINTGANSHEPSPTLTLKALLNGILDRNTHNEPTGMPAANNGLNQADNGPNGPNQAASHSSRFSLLRNEDRVVQQR